LAKARRQLVGLAERLERGRTRKDHDAVEAEIARILKPRWVSRVITTTLSGDRPAAFRLVVKEDAVARRALEEELFGKRVLFTDPGSFETIDHARRWFASFFIHYNFEHYHSGIGLLTPVSVHHGTAGEIIAARQQVLDDAFVAHPERFRRGRPTAAAPEPAWINKPAHADQKEAVTQ
jgi:hypothetical protein